VGLAQLRTLTDDELIRRHDAVAAEDVGDAHTGRRSIPTSCARVVEQEIQ
jgi:hypothetical protein